MPLRFVTLRRGLVLATLVLGVACTPGTPLQAPPQRQSVAFDFETALEDWIALGGSGEVAQRDDVRLSADYARDGHSSVRIRVTSDSHVARGNRAELTLDVGQRAGETGRYTWSVLIPPEYPKVWMEDADGEPNWQVMGQWHQQPDPSRGQTWDRYPGQGASPPIAFVYYDLDEHDPTYQAVRQDPRMLAVAGFDPAWRHVSILMLTYGLPPVPVAVRPIQKGAWVDIEIQIHWSTRDDGWAAAWINGEPLMDEPVRGPNMWNPMSHVFKLGLYRNPDIDGDQVLYYDSFAFQPVDITNP